MLRSENWVRSTNAEGSLENEAKKIYFIQITEITTLCKCSKQNFVRFTIEYFVALHAQRMDIEK